MRERTLFQQAVEIADPAERQRFLGEACGSDTRLRARLDELLRAAGELGDFLETPALEANATSRDSVAPAQAAASAALTVSELFESNRSEFLSPDSPTTTMTSAAQATNLDGRLSFLQPSDQPGSLGRLGHYEVLERIGQGAFGIVLRARDEKLQRIVAIKVMQPHLAQTSPPRKRFLREARACAAIRHPNVVSVYSVEEEPIPYFVMEYVQGITLQEKIDEAGPLEISEVIPLARQLAHALQAAHELGLIHRDIKPSNILLERSTRPRTVITDFGLARTVDDASLTQSGCVAGTPMYMSPEQARGLPLDARSDLFSLGSVLYVVVTGRPPFRASSSMAVLKRVCDASPRPIAEIIPEAPEWICAMIAKLHAKQAGERFGSAKELADFIDQAEADTFQNARVRSQAALQLLQPGSKGAGAAAMGEATTRRFQSVWLKVSLGLAVLAVAFLAGLWRPWFGDTPDKQPDGPVKANSPEVQPSASAVPSHILALWKKLPADAPMPATAPFDAEAAARFQQEWAAYLKLPVEFTNSVGIRFRLIPPGGFDMGCDPLESAQQLAAAGGMAFWEECIRSQSPKHHVAVTEPFYLATTEVTQAQYESVMSRNPSVFSSSGPAAAEVAGLDTLDWPVEGLSWKNAAAFCRALSLRDGLQPTYEFEGDQTNISASAGGYALPTEAQWEMACRAGSVTRYWTGNDAEGLKAAAHFGGGLGHPAPVGQLKPNPFGLYDVHGNVNEWVQDGWLPDYYKQCAAEPLTVDPTGPPESPWHRITKGGDFHYSEGECLSAARFAHDATTIPIYADGVRPVLPWKAVPAALAVRQRAAAEQTDDFVEVHGATLSELRQWLDQLPPSFMPHYFGVRHGSQPPLLDAVASRQANPLPWQVHLTSDFEADFQSMRAEHRTAWRITVPSADPSQDAPTALALWIADDGVPWSTWPIEEEVIETRLAEMSDEGYLPVCLSAAMLEGQRWWELSLRQVPGVGHHTYLELTPEDFIQKVEHYRARHWRPHLIQAVLPSAEFKLTAVFRENYSEIEWQVAMLIDQAEYEQQLTLRKKQGFYPAQVVSVLRDGQPQFIVLWCRGRAVPFEPEDESVAETR